MKLFYIYFKNYIFIKDNKLFTFIVNSDVLKYLEKIFTNVQNYINYLF